MFKHIAFKPCAHQQHFTLSYVCEQHGVVCPAAAFHALVYLQAVWRSVPTFHALVYLWAAWRSAPPAAFHSLEQRRAAWRSAPTNTTATKCHSCSFFSCPYCCVPTCLCYLCVYVCVRVRVCTMLIVRVCVCVCVRALGCSWSYHYYYHCLEKGKLLNFCWLVNVLSPAFFRICITFQKQGKLAFAVHCCHPLHFPTFASCCRSRSGQPQGSDPFKPIMCTTVTASRTM